MKILVADRLAEAGLAVLREAAEGGLGLVVDDRSGISAEELLEAIGEYDALIVRSRTRVTAEVIDRARRLRVIGRAGIGVDNIDLVAATRRGIVVMNTPGGNNVTTAEHAIAMMMALARWIPQASASVKAGEWKKGKFIGSELAGKILGIVGAGNIGSLVADRARGLHMKVLACDPFITAEKARQLEVELVSLEELAERADFVSIHVPLTPETRNLIGRTFFERMKRGARLINCARGGIVDEEALADAIREGKLAGAALDVFAQEPPPPNHPLLALEQVVCTPHLGAATDEAQVNVAVAIARQIVDFLARGEMRNAVNVPSVSPELRERLNPFLELGAKLGSLQAQLLSAAPQTVQIEYAGEVAELDTRPVTIAVLHGLLSRLVESGTVNYVNAREVARERGIEVVETRSREPKGFLNFVAVRVQTPQASSEVAGAVFGHDVVRLVKIDDFHLEAVPAGHILILHNRDVPGVVGNVGTLLGQVGINIAGLQLGRKAAGGMAISLIHVDDPVPEEVLDRLRRLPNVVQARAVEL